ncbi:MAG: AAA family ATPase [Roseburia sp.]
MGYKYVEGMLQGWKAKKNLTIPIVIQNIKNIISLEDNLKSNRSPRQQRDYEDKYLSQIKECYAFIAKKFSLIKLDQLSELAGAIAESKFWTYALYDSDFRQRDELLEINGDKLYLLLADFWEGYNRTFVDYAKAIKMLCEFYKPEYWEVEEADRERIIDAFFTNIKLCGDAGDFGYCYTGINAIAEKMKGLNDQLIANIVRQYTGYEIVTLAVYRHQIVTLIDCITEDQKLQNYLRNTVLYGVLAANMLARLLTLNNEYMNNVYYEVWNNKQYKIKDFEAHKEEPFFICGNKWQIKDEKERYIIEIKDVRNSEEYANKKICLKRLGKNSVETEILFHAEPYEWRLNDLVAKKEIRNEIKKWLYNGEGERFCFSYLYIKNFRGLSSQQISFMHEYIFDPEMKKIQKDKSDYFDTNGFYDGHVKSISCIVGKNGAGKTSIIEFLGKYFSVIVGKYDEKKKKLPDILKDLELPENIEFLVIFQYGQQHYYLSNMEGVVADDSVKNYYEARGLLSGNGERDKVYYFSNKVDLWSVEKLETKDKRDEDAFSQIEYTRVNDLREIHFLKESTAHRINLMRCYVFSYVKYCLMKNEKTFDELEWEGIRLIDHLVPDMKETWKKIMEIPQKKSIEVEEVKEFFFEKESVCFLLSSGQEAKLTFLAKLYWCVEGYKKFLEEYGNYLKKGREQIDISRCIQRDEAAIIYIDEGDLYYHPEWQRQFVESVCEILHERKEMCQLQVVVATNSPYILSDFFQQDVVYILDENLSSPNTETFAQNIHTLLSSPFFMDSTLGSIAHRKIVGVIELLGKKCEGKKENEQFERGIKELFKIEKAYIDIQDYLMKFSDFVGEELYKMQIKRLLSEAYPKKTMDEEDSEAIEREIKRLRDRLEEIKRRK